MTVAAPGPVLGHDDTQELKEFVIFRLDGDGGCEFADESNLLLEAKRYAGLMAAIEAHDGIHDGIHDVHEVHYEVRRAATGGLLYTTRDTRQVSAAIA